MGEAENVAINLIKTENKTYNLDNPEEGIKFLIYALEGKIHFYFIDFVFAHIGINVFEYSQKFVENGSKSIYEIQQDASPFFDFLGTDFIEDNIFYKYIYESAESDLTKKLNINKIIDGLKTTLGYYFDSQSVSIFRNSAIDKNYDFIRQASKTLEFCNVYTYYCICILLMNFYDYLYDQFYVYIDSKNTFDYQYSNKIEVGTEKDIKSNEVVKIEEKEIIWINIFKEKKDFESFKYYLKNEIANDYNDISYLFQRLKDDNKLEDVKQSLFADWMCRNGLINKRLCDDFIEKGFSTKANSTERINKYNKVFKK